MKLYNICFSARGTTQACASTIASGMNMETVSCNWLEKPCTEPMAIAREDRLLFSMPVYAGYIPKLCAKMLKNLQAFDQEGRTAKIPKDKIKGED